MYSCSVALAVTHLRAASEALGIGWSSCEILACCFPHAYVHPHCRWGCMLPLLRAGLFGGVARRTCVHLLVMYESCRVAIAMPPSRHVARFPITPRQV